MAILIRPRHWNIQPPVGAQIDFGHPLAKGLTFYTLFNAAAGLQKALLPAGLPGNGVGTAPTPEWKSGPDGGISQNWNGSFSLWYERGSWVEPVNACSVVSRQRRVGTNGSFATPGRKTYQNDTVLFSSYGISYNPGGAGQDVVSSDVAVNGSGRSGNNVTLPAGSTLNAHTIAQTCNANAGVLKLYYNGIVKDSISFTGGTMTYDTTSTGRLIVSGDSSAAIIDGTPWSGQIYYFGVWNRVLTPSELEWIHIEPYAMLVPTGRKKYFMAPARAYTFYVAAEKII